jgi:hypothetical protein
MKRLGPELKMPKLKGSEMKVPPFLSDLYYDLSERRLLPIIALIVVAIVAAPFLLGGESSESEPVPTPTTGGGATATASQRSLTVVEAEPGLRNYKKRLAHRSPTDPFKQRFNGPVLKNGELNPQTGTTSTTVTTSEGSPGTGETVPGPSSGGPVYAPGTIIHFAYAIDVRITKSGGSSSASSSASETDSRRGTDSESEPDLEAETYSGPGTTSNAAAKPKPNSKPKSKSKSETEIKHRVLPLTSLPGPKAPVVTYLAPAKAKKDNVILLISDKVTSVFGESRCVAGVQVCQLLEVEPHFPVTFAFGANGARYTIELLKMERVVTGHS